MNYIIFQCRNVLKEVGVNQHVANPKKQTCGRQNGNRQHKRLTNPLQHAKQLFEHGVHFLIS
ncbi:hypothetical protein D3C73_600430 [compost metagenome]